VVASTARWSSARSACSAECWTRGRTLQGKEEDERKERQSTVATDDSIRLPPALRAKLMGDDDRLRVPSWEELQQLTPEERRLVVDYFRRLSEPGGR